MKIKCLLLALFMILLSCGDDENNTINPPIDDDTTQVQDSSKDSSSTDSNTVDSSTVDSTLSQEGVLHAPNFEGMISATEKISAFEINKLIGCGINLGNCFEGSDGEGSWGVTLEENYFKMIADSGFTSVRVPIRWYIQNAKEAPYTIDSTFFARIDWTIDNALKHGLMVIINQHHYDPLYEDFDGNIEEFLAIWGQIAHRYQNYPQNLVFEIMNEPREQVVEDNLTMLMHKAIDTIRVTNPERKLIISGDEWGGIDGLANIVLPANTENIIATFHFYEPHRFTHQGANWSEDVADLSGIKWENTYPEQIAMLDRFKIADKWSKTNNIPLYMGEFGAYSAADDTSRFYWTQYVQNLSEHFEFSNAYWEFCSSFGVYNASKDEYNTFLMNALLRNDGVVVTSDNRPLDETYMLLDDFENEYGDGILMNAIYAAKGTAEGLVADSLYGGAWYGYHNSLSSFSTLDNVKMDVVDRAVDNDDTVAVKAEADRINAEREKMFDKNGIDGSNALSLIINIKSEEPDYAFVGIGTNLSNKETGNDYIDLSNLTAVSFFAKGDASLRLKFGTAITDTTKYDGAQDWGTFGKKFEVTEEWTQVKIFADELIPSEYSLTAESGATWDDAKIAVNEFQISDNSSYDPGCDDTFFFTIDDIKLHGLTSADFGF